MKLPSCALTVALTVAAGYSPALPFSPGVDPTMSGGRREPSRHSATRPAEDFSSYIVTAITATPYNDHTGDTTRVYSTSGTLLTQINDSHENQLHFVNKRQFDQMTKEEHDSVDDYATRVRRSSVAFIGGNTIGDMQDIVKEANGAAAEIAFVGDISESREIRLEKLPADGSNSLNGIQDPQAQVDKKYTHAEQSGLFLYGHVHPEGALKNGYTEAQRAWSLGTPTGMPYGGFSPRPVDFYERLRDAHGHLRPHVGMVATSYGFSLYRTAKWRQPASEVSRTSYHFFKAGKVE